MKSTGPCSTIISLKAQIAFEPGNLISLRGSILSKVHIFLVLWIAFNKWQLFALGNSKYALFQDG